MRIEFDDSPAITVDLLGRESVKSFMTRLYPLVSRNLSKKEKTSRVKTTAELTRKLAGDSLHHNYIIVRLREDFSCIDLLVKRDTVYYIAWRSCTEEWKSPWVFMRLVCLDTIKISKSLSFRCNTGQLYIKCLDDKLVFSAAKEREIQEFVMRAKASCDLIFPEFMEIPISPSYESLAEFSIDPILESAIEDVREKEDHMLNSPLGMDSVREAVRGLKLTRNSTGQWVLPDNQVLASSIFNVILFVPEGSRFHGISQHFQTYFTNLSPLPEPEKILLFCWRNASKALKLFYLDAGVVKLKCKRQYKPLTMCPDINHLLDNVKLIQKYTGHEIMEWIDRCSKSNILAGEICKKTLSEAGQFDTSADDGGFILTREPRQLISVGGTDVPSDEMFSILSYNILADGKATNDLYTYCPPEALSWIYRREEVLNEIVGYDADIICLQEVQKEHFEDFFHLSWLN